MNYNVIDKFIQEIDADCDTDVIANNIRTVLNELGSIYSYLIYANYKDGRVVSWRIQYNISQRDEYNKLSASNVIDNILYQTLSLKHDCSKQIIGYMNPPLEQILIAFDPLIQKLSYEESQRWRSIEYDDAYQMCRLVLIELYRRGYYIHKTLLRKAYRNYILAQLRRDIDKPDIISLTSISHKGEGDSEDLTFGDMIQDKALDEELEEQERHEVSRSIFEQVRDLIIMLIGEREFDQLMRQYSSGNTDNRTQKKMYDIKNKLSRLGITSKSFDKYR